MTTYEKAKFLFLPLGIVAVILFILHSWQDPSGLYLNIATEVIGIILTVTYVDWIIRKHEEAKWQETMELVRNRTRLLFNHILASVRVHLNYDVEGLNEFLMRNEEYETSTSHEAFLDYFESVVLPSLPGKLQTINSGQWIALNTHFTKMTDEISTFIDRYDAKLAPNA